MERMVDSDVCVFCSTELSLWEKTRCYCWNCGEIGTDSYHEDTED